MSKIEIDYAKGYALVPEILETKYGAMPVQSASVSARDEWVHRLTWCCPEVPADKIAKVVKERITSAAGYDEEAAVMFLKSRWGRRFLGMVASDVTRGHALSAALDAVIRQSLEWRVDTRTAAEFGVPAGGAWLPTWVRYYHDYRV